MAPWGTYTLPPVTVLAGGSNHYCKQGPCVTMQNTVGLKVVGPFLKVSITQRYAAHGDVMRGRQLTCA